MGETFGFLKELIGLSRIQLAAEWKRQSPIVIWLYGGLQKFLIAFPLFSKFNVS